jgi:hypothetical protein
MVFGFGNKSFLNNAADYATETKDTRPAANAKSYDYGE